MRLTTSPYWTAWKDEQYDRTERWANGDSWDVRDRFSHVQWGINADAEWRTGERGWFWVTGLGYSYQSQTRAHLVLDDHMELIASWEDVDRADKLLVNGGTGKRWKLGDGDVRAALVGGIMGICLGEESAGHRLRPLPIVGLSISYQFEPGSER